MATCALGHELLWATFQGPIIPLFPTHAAARQLAKVPLLTAAKWTVILAIAAAIGINQQLSGKVSWQIADMNRGPLFRRSWGNSRR
jgi:hypothetical protein